MPELTVAMPAHNTAAYIGDAIASVLRQREVDFELIVVDDGSDDATPELVRRFDDPRLRLLRNDRRRGIGFCHNLIIRQSQAPFIVHVDSDDVVWKTDAFAKLLQKIRSSERIGQVHCYHFQIDAKGRITQDAFRAARKRLVAFKTPNLDYRRNLLVHGSVNNHLRMYRKAVFENVGLFNDQIACGVDYDMALRIVDKYEIALVPEFLYALRKHARNTSDLRHFRGLRFWWQRLSFCNRLLKNGEIRFPRERRYKKSRLMLVGLLYVLRLPRLVSFLRSRLSPGRILDAWQAKILRPLASLVYRGTVRSMAWWPIGLVSCRTAQRPARAERLALYLRHFPAPSQTFVQREIAALKSAGLAVLVVADDRETTSQSSESALDWSRESRYLLPIDADAWPRYRNRFLRTHPLRYLNLLLYVVFHRYGATKNFREDLSLFHRAVHLAGVFKEVGITHVHAPRPDRPVFIALIAARLLGITYSVRARARDLHQQRRHCALREKFAHASFIVTNSEHDNVRVQKLLPHRKRRKVNTVYEGIDLERFQPGGNENSGQRVALLSVARLIEEKGLVVLLRACKILQERGCLFHCRIIGGPELPRYSDYYLSLKKLHKTLGLENCVTLLGPQPFAEVMAHYRAADIFVLPCIAAGNADRDVSPTVLIEAMAMELAVVSTTISAIPEIVEQGASGLLVPPDDPPALAEALARLAGNPALRRSLGKRARERVERRFDIAKNVRQFTRLCSASVTSTRALSKAFWKSPERASLES
jgi:glycosyltransferase involved in cell wall biosynthesis